VHPPGVVPLCSKAVCCQSMRMHCTLEACADEEKSIIDAFRKLDMHNQSNRA
jgi:hypothetical protein